MSTSETFKASPATRGTPILARSFQIIIGLIGCAIRSFAIGLMVLEVLWGVLLAGVCFGVASDGSTLRGIVALAIAILFVTISAFILAVYFAALSVIRKAVTDAGVGRIIFNSLFEYVLGVRGDDTGEQPEDVKVATHLSQAEVEKVLNAAAKHLFAMEMPSTKWAGPMFWLAKQIQRVAVWATVRVVIKSCSDDPTSVNLLELRDRLTSTIDDGVVAYLKQYFSRLALSLISGVSAVAVLISFGIRQLPF